MFTRVNKDPGRMTLAKNRAPCYGAQIPGDGSDRPSYRPSQTLPGKLFMGDLKDSGLYPNSLTVKLDKDRMKVSIAMCHYAPEEIKLEMVDGFVVVEAQHAERKEKRSFIARHFTRRFALPKSADLDGVRAKLSVYGWLSIVVPLLQTGQAEFWSPSGEGPAKDGPEPELEQAPQAAPDKKSGKKKGRPIPMAIIE